MSSENTNRRQFVAGAAALTLASQAMAKSGGMNKMAPARVIGANDKINVAVIGVGGRGAYVADKFDKYAQTVKPGACQIVGVCDTYQKRVTAAKDRFKCKGTLDYRELISDPGVDAVIVATPDHWHAPIALAAMDNGKDVYLEKPMCHTVDEVKQLMATVKETGRVLQVGSQTTSADQWWKARKAIEEGRIGKMIMSQGSYHRNSTEGEWNWKIDPAAGPEGKGEDFIDWKMWLGKAPKRSFDADRFFRFRKYWDYSGGIATDLFFHVMAPMNICWSEAQFPVKVSGSGGIYQFKDEREVPDTFHFMAEYAKGFSVVLTSSMANSQHIPGLIRGHEGTIIMVEHGMFESSTPFITVKPEKRVMSADYKSKFGEEVVKIDVEQKDIMFEHIGNFLDCVHSRQKPTLNVETAGHAQVVITMAVQSYRQGKVLYFDEKNFKIVDKPVKA
ncbi:Gfo/Idh/MocA family protein [Paludibaculum fermentans]|uniref:Gfo/Idh/MocA family protein n=1 Tax=Paludibaculum fermentans TaxID=1473598 RepID=UPI003EBF87F0